MKDIAQSNKSREVAYPIYDLAEAVKVAEAVRDLGGGNVPVSKSLLAQQLKYAESGPSFFQRVGAAKAFGLIDGWGSYSLTEQAKQYFYPTVENGKETAAVAILTFPKAFAVLVQKFDGGKLPATEMIGNIIHKEADIPVSKKNTLAACFVRSAQFLKVIDAGGFLRCKAFVAGSRTAAPLQSPDKTPEEKLKEAIAKGQVPKVFSINEQKSFYLDKQREREVTLDCPFSITQLEYDRICNWIKATWIIEKENTQ
jgi:hypothetical protein